MPTPSSTTISSDEIELFAWSPKTLVASAISALAVEDTTAIRTSSGSTARIGERKMISSVIRMIAKAPANVSTLARLEESCWSRACAAEPPSLASRCVPFVNLGEEAALVAVGREAGRGGDDGDRGEDPRHDRPYGVTDDAAPDAVEHFGFPFLQGQK